MILSAKKDKPIRDANSRRKNVDPASDMKSECTMHEIRKKGDRVIFSKLPRDEVEINRSNVPKRETSVHVQWSPVVLHQQSSKVVSSWLSDEKRVALSIWDEKLIEERGDNVYRMKLMKLQFVTIQLSPTVDNRMWTEEDASGAPVFKLQSIDFDPNVQVIPGLNIPASALGIEIEVVGELLPSRNGKGLGEFIASMNACLAVENKSSEHKEQHNNKLLLSPTHLY